MLPVSDADSWVWTLASGVVVFAVSVVMLFCTYKQWETPADLRTASAICLTYFVASITRRTIRFKQAAEKREAKLP